MRDRYENLLARCGAKSIAVYNAASSNCLALAYNQNIYYYVPKLYKDQVVVFLQNIVTLMLHIIFKGKKSTTYYF